MKLLLRHVQVLVSVTGQLCRGWLNTLLAAGVIGIALALPAGLYLALQGLDGATAGWEGRPQISAFLEKTASDGDASRLRDEIAAWDGISTVRYISPDQALEEFKQKSGLGTALELLDENPLPGVLIVEPESQSLSSTLLEESANRIAKLPRIDNVQLDTEWVSRLYSLLSLGTRATLLLGVVLGTGVVLITGNTIRLAIFSRRDEIEITKLIGGTDAFIRRPFLYFGLLQGFCGGLVAVLLVWGAILLLHAPLEQLLHLYGNSLPNPAPRVGFYLTLLASGGLLGLGGAWLAVGRHLREIEPR